jgi:hypothetical protein
MKQLVQIEIFKMEDGVMNGAFRGIIKEPDPDHPGHFIVLDILEGNERFIHMMINDWLFNNI